jgi:hypothetical protein
VKCLIDWKCDLGNETAGLQRHDKRPVIQLAALQVPRVIPKMISTPSVFYIRRMLMPTVDLAPTHMRARIKTGETGAGDANYMNGRRVRGVTGAYPNHPANAREGVA